MPEIVSTQLIVGLEVHVELSTRSKMFAPVASLAHPSGYDAPPNTLVDPVVLALPGALPVMNKAAVELAAMVGLALGCRIAPFSVWDRKSYFYPDLPKNYQISQYQLPLCFDGSVELPPITPQGRVDYDALAADAAGPGGPIPGTRIGIIRAHLEEDAGKLLHEAPAEWAGEQPVEGSIVDYNRAGTPLLEIVTQPDFTSADQVVVFCQMLRNICRFLGASEGVMQRGHIRFEPNINCRLTLADGHTVHTPVVEIKNLNSFRSVKGAIEHELREQPRRWLTDRLERSPGSKTTRGWDDVAGTTFLQREKEEAHDYRYFPDPDLVPVAIDDAWRERIAARVTELPLDRCRRYIRQLGLPPKDAAALTEERDVCLFFETTLAAAIARGVDSGRAGKLAANAVLQSGAKRANERTTMDRQVLVSDLGISPAQVAGIIALREAGTLNSTSADELFGALCEGGGEAPGADPEAVAKARGWLIVRDAGALEAWCDQVIAASPKAADDVRAGKLQALGRLVGETMKLAGGAADAKAVRETLLKKLGQG
ncbi:MAG: Asp-tRNA(Asn)/Glu-tRNA(Gln) amidotransferase subunit GatB [Phycisphaerales bacterium]|nr:Asp-tRNA(Asn)/Glu-tRNA(Gln) amidotransferase subunit GatB [Phycisphaerales bacterium]